MKDILTSRHKVSSYYSHKIDKQPSAGQVWTTTSNITTNKLFNQSMIHLTKHMQAITHAILHKIYGNRGNCQTELQINQASSSIVEK